MWGKAILIAAASSVVTALLIGTLSLWSNTLFLKAARRFRWQLWGKSGRSLNWFLKWVSAIVILGAVAFAVTGTSPVLRLSVLFSVPLLIPLGIPLYRHLRRQDMETSAIPFFYALLGMLRVGMSLPSALFQLSDSVDAPFSEALNYFLRRFRQGVPLSKCLTQFRDRAELRRAALCLVMLEMAYSRGLPVVQTLERMVPIMEVEESARKRIRSVQGSVALQGTIAALMPWFLGALLHFTDPQPMEAFLSSWVAIPVLGLALGLETVGVFLLWQNARYY